MRTIRMKTPRMIIMYSCEMIDFVIGVRYNYNDELCVLIDK